MHRTATHITVLAVLTALLGACGQENSDPADSTASPQRPIQTAAGPSSAPSNPAPATSRPATTARDVAPPDTAPAPDAALPRTPAPAPLPGPDERDELLLDFVMTDQDGRAVNLEDMLGQPIALTFIFTSCSDPDMCPMITATMASLQYELKQAGLGQKVRLALLTYDPWNDTPDVLKHYGTKYGVKYTNALMLRPDPDEMRDVREAFSVRPGYRQNMTIEHRWNLILIDHAGRLVRHRSGVWKNGPVVSELRQLVEEAAVDG